MPPARPRPRPDLDHIRAYRVASPPVRVRLHSNENPYPPPPAVMDEIVREIAALDLNRYPDIEARALREALGEYAGVEPDWIWTGTGSNEVLLESCLAYGGPGRTALLFEPTYRMHHRQAEIAGTRVQTAGRGEDFRLDPAEAAAAVQRLRPDVVFVCSPDNPTGAVTPPETIAAVAEAAPGLVLVDEAYYEFGGVTFAGRLPEFPNVIVVRTLSKAFRMAGVRLGYAVAQPETLEALLKVRMPYAQSALAQVAARVAVRRRAEVLAPVAELVAERERIAARLAEIGVRVFPSGANFLLFRPPDAGKLLDGLAGEGILVRDFRHLEGCEECLRVTVGTPEENHAFLEAVARLV